MPVHKYREILEDVKGKPVFGVEDLRKRGVPGDYAKTLLYRLKERDEVRRVERGKYTTIENPLLVAPFLTTPSYLSLWTALRFHDLTQQSPFGIEVVSSRSRYNRKIEFNGTEIRFHEVKPAMMFGYSYEAHENVRVPVANQEKAVIDGIYLDLIPREEVRDIVSELDWERLRNYAARAGTAVAKRVEEVMD